MMVIESWGWLIEWSPAFMGSGMLAGINVSVSYYMGSMLAWCVFSNHGLRGFEN